MPGGVGDDASQGEPEEWPALLRRGRVERVDAGLATWDDSGAKTSRHFINIAMGGLGADIVHTMERSGKPLGRLPARFEILPRALPFVIP